jgi:hypothetical protein
MAKAKRRVTIDGSILLTEEQVAARQAEDEKRVVAKTEALIKQGKIKPELVAKWREKHPESSAKKSQDKAETK